VRYFAKPVYRAFSPDSFVGEHDLRVESLSGNVLADTPRRLVYERERKLVFCGAIILAISAEANYKAHGEWVLLNQIVRISEDAGNTPEICETHAVNPSSLGNRLDFLRPASASVCHPTGQGAPGY